VSDNDKDATLAKQLGLDRMVHGDAAVEHTAEGVRRVDPALIDTARKMIDLQEDREIFRLIKAAALPNDIVSAAQRFIGSTLSANDAERRAAVVQLRELAADEYYGEDGARALTGLANWVEDPR